MNTAIHHHSRYLTAAMGPVTAVLLAYSAIASSYVAAASIAGVNTGSIDAAQVLISQTATATAAEKKHSGWSLAFDNDILVPASRDQDYTYGVSATLSGTAARDSGVSLHQPLAWLNKKLSRILDVGAGAGMGTGIGGHGRANHRIEMGLYGFTPEDISRQEANQDDRPYASLMYFSSSQQQQGVTDDVSWRSTLTIGVLGLDVVGSLQNEVHKLTGSDEAKGWQHQISDGGELTARYSAAKQRRWQVANPNIEIKSTWQGSVGYLTEASWGMSLRIGQLSTPWQSFNPELTAYRENAVNTGAASGDEHYFMAGFALKARAYNAFLQGQFRTSEVSYHGDELNHGIVEAWLGYSHVLSRGYRVSYLLRGHSSEVKSGTGDRNVMWGGLILSKTI